MTEYYTVSLPAHVIEKVDLVLSGGLYPSRAEFVTELIRRDTYARNLLINQLKNELPDPDGLPLQDRLTLINQIMAGRYSESEMNQILWGNTAFLKEAEA